MHTDGSLALFVVRGLGLAIVLVAMVALASDLFRETSSEIERELDHELAQAVVGRLQPATAVAFVLIGTAPFWLPATGVLPKLAAQSLLVLTLFACSIAAVRGVTATRRATRSIPTPRSLW